MVNIDVLSLTLILRHSINTFFAILVVVLVNISCEMYVALNNLLYYSLTACHLYYSLTALRPVLIARGNKFIAWLGEQLKAMTYILFEIEHILMLYLAPP